MKNIEEIYVYLLDEGIDVWRPVDAIKIEENLYKIVSIRDYNKIELLEFNVGDIVNVEEKLLSSGNARKIAISLFSEKVKYINYKFLIFLILFFFVSFQFFSHTQKSFIFYAYLFYAAIFIKIILYFLSNKSIKYLLKGSRELGVYTIIFNKWNFINKEKCVKALKYFKKAVEINDRNICAYINVAFCYNKLEEFEKAKNYLLIAKKISPKNLLVLQNLIYSEKQLLNIKKMEEYIAEFNSLENNKK